MPSASGCCGRRSTTSAGSSTSTSPGSAGHSTCPSTCAWRRFHEQVLRELALVPYGQVDTYGHLAARVGRPKAARAVGTVMNRNPLAIVLPCHRIVGANGSLTGYAGGLDIKRALLALEGATLAV